MLKGYHYEGPLPLGSVVAHNCGAAGLFSQKKDAQVELIGRETADVYHLTVIIDGKEKTCLHGNADSLGRRRLGQELLAFLRIYQGLDSVNEWGSLVGVRPTKLFHKTVDKLGSIEETKNSLLTEFSISEEKLDLLSQVATFQRPYVEPRSGDDRLISVYGGIPFCQSRCTYCSFPFGLIQDYKNLPFFVEAFIKDSRDLKELIQTYGLEVASLYMGGGTPTSLDAHSFGRILSALQLVLPEGREFTVEAGRPDSIDQEKIDYMIRCGVNRMSINPQTMQDHILKAIGRGHSRDSIKELYAYIRKHTQFSINMDFIAGLPTQSMENMVENMDFVCKARPENVTIHTLALKRGSPLYEGIGREDMPPMEVVKEMVAYTSERLQAEGYVPYYLYRQQYMTGQLENIGYTLPGKACAYNIYMMEERQSILSVGPGSSSKWMRGPDYRQSKQHMPKNVDVYCTTLDTLLEKRHSLSKEFWEV